ncbi:MAG: hypothetical protein ABSD30_02570 [Candidatus Binatus sp.]|jgi:hypothetical protein
MRTIVTMTIAALCATTLAGCWFYTRPDPATSCQKTTYGVAVAATSTEDCEPAPQASATPSPMIHPMPPPLPSPGMM